VENSRRVPLVLAGVLIDLLDLTLSGPLGPAGAIAAAAVVWWVAGQHRVARGARIALAAGAALYCALPLTELVPLGTVVGAVLSLWPSRRREEPRDGGRADG
jgi:hypothetical protein